MSMFYETFSRMILNFYEKDSIYSGEISQISQTLKKVSEKMKANVNFHKYY